MSNPASDRVVTTTVRGSAADDTGTADQNAVAVRVGSLVGATIVAVAGGHGLTRGPNSHIGARIAADVAATKAEAAVAALPSTEAGALAPLGGVLAARIVEQWQAQVRGHIAAQPAAGDDVVVDGGAGEQNADPLSVYGTGLLLAIVTPTAVLALQLGNGDIVLRSDGETVRPLAVDAASDSSDADSLALADAQSHFRHAAVDRTARDIALVLIAVGLDQATADPDWPARLAADLATQAEEHGVDAVEEQLPGRVAGTAGDGEDVTVALVFPAAAITVGAAAGVTDPGLAATIANPAVAAATATAAAPAVTTSELPAVAAFATARRRPWIIAAVAVGAALFAIGLVLVLSRDKGSTTPATTVTTTPATNTSTTVRTTTSTSPPTSAAPSSAPATAPPPTTLPAVVTVPTTAAPPRTTTAPPPPTTTAPPPTTVPVTPSSPPTT